MCKPERSQGGKQQRLLTANGDIVDISSLQPTPDGRFVTTLQTPDQCPPHASTTAISPQETSLGEWVQGAGDRLDRQDRRSRDSVSSFSSCIGDGEDDAAGWSGWTQGSVDGEVTSRHPDENSLAFLQTLRRHNLKVALCLLSHTSVNLTSSASLPPGMDDHAFAHGLGATGARSTAGGCCASSVQIFVASTASGGSVARGLSVLVDFLSL